MISAVTQNACTGCCACLNACPKKSIRIETDAEGFIQPVVDETMCNECGICLKKCPVYSPVPIPDGNFAEAHAAWSLNEDTRRMSTSGGVFSEIAQYVIESGGVVVGARYTKQHLVKHFLISSVDEIAILRQSKYIQSTIGTTFQEIAEKLDSGIPVAFCGTPCQNSGLVAYIGKKPENLLLLDFICHGVNSPKAYLKYLEMLERDYHSPVSRVWFKNKTYGWNRFCTRVDFKNGNYYLKDRNTDLFMYGYIDIDSLYMRQSCYECRFKGYKRLSDITLADFWGCGKIDSSFDPDKGTSLIVVHSKKGQDVLEKMKNQLYVSPPILDDRVYLGNVYALRSPAKNPNREVFLHALDTMPFDECMRKYGNK